MSPLAGSKSQADTTRVGVSVWYIVWPSGLKARPLLIVIPESTRVSEKSGSRRYSAAVEASRASFMLPASRRP